ncbi:MAG: anaerobic glycerol-3-phosphate dehydrogenase subunit C [Nitrospirae bacterium]|nr:anaerobic glycerol-3-phosphate dehydrogenase subunit C [Nitrospirota bacterium]
MIQEHTTSVALRGLVEKCNSCHNCISYCPFFPKVFDLLDQEQYGKSGLLEREYEGVLELCYDCKLCKIACPFKFDLPAVVLKAKAEVMRTGKRPWIKEIFRKVDFVDSASGWFAPVLNPLLKNRPFRKLLEKMVGIHRDRILPTFHFMSFRKWTFLAALFGMDRWRQNVNSQKTIRRVVYFHGCYTDHHRPQEGVAALKVFEACGIDVVIPEQRCCGLPQLSEGFPEEAQKNMAYNMNVWKQYLDAGYDIVVTSSPCSLTLKQEYPEYMGSAADILKGRVFEVTEYLHQLLQRGEIKPPMAPIPQRVAYHVPCHLKAQNMGMPSLTLLQQIPGLKLSVVDRGCCGLAGCMGYTTDSFPLSMEIGSPMIEGIRELLPDQAVSDCPKCNLQIQQGTGIAAVHPLELLAQGYEKERYVTLHLRETAQKKSLGREGVYDCP